MTESVRELMRTFEALPPAEQHEVAVEILRRSTPDDGLPSGALDEVAAELFRGYDAEEEASAPPGPR
jgi:hypothetical protein